MLQIELRKPGRCLKIEFWHGGGGIWHVTQGNQVGPVPVAGTTSVLDFIPRAGTNRYLQRSGGAIAWVFGEESSTPTRQVAMAN
jgi:hypothetical protein